MVAMFPCFCLRPVFASGVVGYKHGAFIDGLSSFPGPTRAVIEGLGTRLFMDWKRH